MRHLLTLFFVLCSAVWALPQSLQLGGGVSGTATFPNAAPYRRADLLNAVLVWEFRLHGNGQGTPISIPGSQQDVLFGGNTTLWVLIGADGTLTATNYFDAPQPVDDLNSSVNISGRTDIIVRIVRDGVLNLFWIEIQNIDGSGYSSGAIKTISARGTGPQSSGGTGTIGGLQVAPSSFTGARMAWLRWHTATTVNRGKSFPRDFDNTSGYLAAYEFENETSSQVADGSGHSNALAMAGTRTYSNTPVYAPACILTVATTYRAGVGNALDGSASSQLNGNSTPLTYEWQQLDGPSTLRWSSLKVVQPSVFASVFGSYNIWLRVKDSDGQTTSCSAKHTFVATDANGVSLVSNPDHLKYFSLLAPGVPSAAANASGAAGVNQWPYYIDRAKVIAEKTQDLFNANPDTWDTPSTHGVITISNGCNGTSGTGCSTVTGSGGTQFTTDFCADPENYPDILIHYRSTLYPGQTGRRRMAVVSCVDDSHMTIGFRDGNRNPYAADFITWPDHMSSNTTNMSYSRIDDSAYAWWGFSQLTGMYYDPPEGLYWLYYATGDTTYRDRARVMADQWWMWSAIDGGGVIREDTGNQIYAEPRNIAFQSLMLRAMDGRPEMWPGLRRILEFYYNHGINDGGRVGDLRNAGYTTGWLAMASIFDPDATQRSHWYTYLTNRLNDTWEPNVIISGTSNQWRYWIGTDAGLGGYFNFGSYHKIFNGTATVTTNSRTVGGSGTNFLTTTTDDQGVEGCVAGGYIWFFPTGSMYILDNKGEPQGEYYAYKIESVGGDNSLTLVRPYAGANGSRDYGCIGNNPDGGNLGTWVQPFMLGIDAQAFTWARLAASPTYFNDATSFTKWTAHALGAARYIRDVSYIPSTLGTKYMSRSPSSETPIFADSCNFCSNGLDKDATQQNTVESFWIYALLQTLEGDSSTRATYDARFGGIYGKPGSGGLVEDSGFMQSLENNWPTNSRAQKWFGYMTGTGKNWAYLTARMGGLQSPNVKTVPVWLGAPSSTNSACSYWSLTVTTPDGNTSAPQSCSTASCTVSADARIGGSILNAKCMAADNTTVLRSLTSPFTPQ